MKYAIVRIASSLTPSDTRTTTLTPDSADNGADYAFVERHLMPGDAIAIIGSLGVVTWTLLEIGER